MVPVGTKVHRDFASNKQALANSAPGQISHVASCFVGIRIVSRFTCVLRLRLLATSWLMAYTRASLSGVSHLGVAPLCKCLWDLVGSRLKSYNRGVTYGPIFALPAGRLED